MTQTKTRIIGESAPVLALIKMVERVAAADTGVLIVGESGTGKELVARMIHERSPRAKSAFVAVNCGAIPENLIESELFGHKKGSFTGAVADKPGLFEVASGGTLFLDEIGELPVGMQVKLLRALQEKTIRRVGGNDDIKINARIVAATNRDLELAIKKGTFREDLYYRLNVIQLRTPPLRERSGDVRILAEFFLKKYEDRHQGKLKGFDPQAMRALENYAWPGNVRELENVIERAATMSAGEDKARVDLSALPLSVQDAVPRVSEDKPGQSKNTAVRLLVELPYPDFNHGTIPLDEILKDVERRYLQAALEHSGGVKKQAADLLGITFRSIRYRLKELGLE